ncbi:hypothetical protein VB737_03490, partial [Synechococcus sp. BA-120 BA3]|nr:hypothetical protein [Synechococcus sp. BA-120 BA3]
TLERLRASRRLQQRCQRLRHWHERIQRSAAPEGRPSLEALDEADQLQMHRQLEEDLPALLMPLDPAPARAAVARWRNPEDRLFHPRPPLDGRRLQQLLGIPPGPRLGQLIDHLTAERAFGRLGGTAATDTAELTAESELDEVLDAARLWLDRPGPGVEPDPRRD